MHAMVRGLVLVWLWVSEVRTLQHGWSWWDLLDHFSVPSSEWLPADYSVCWVWLRPGEVKTAAALCALLCSYSWPTQNVLGESYPVMCIE